MTINHDCWTNEAFLCGVHAILEDAINRSIHSQKCMTSVAIFVYLSTKYLVVYRKLQMIGFGYLQ